MDELSEEDKLTVARARKIQRFLSQPFQVAEVFTGHPGKLVPLEETIKVSTWIESIRINFVGERLDTFQVGLELNVRTSKIDLNSLFGFVILFQIWRFIYSNF